MKEGVRCESCGAYTDAAWECFGPAFVDELLKSGPEHGSPEDFELGFRCALLIVNQIGLVHTTKTALRWVQRVRQERWGESSLVIATPGSPPTE